MGNPNSKQAIEDDPAKGNLPSTPILTPKLRMADLDPRSPSDTIVRTPIQTITQYSNNQTPIIGFINTKMFSNNDQDNDLINIDPRSPTVEFKRTPIATGSLTSEIRKKHLNILRQTMNMTPTKFTPQKKTGMDDEVKASNDKPKENESDLPRRPKLLEVTPITKKPNEEQIRNSTIGLLETNLDYVETNIDEIVTTVNNLDPLLSVPAPELKPKTETNIQKNTAETVSNENPTKDFDKKVSNLIYEDNQTSDLIPVAMKTAKGRIALGERNRTEGNRNGNISKLKVNDKPTLRKQDNLSKIPIYKKKLIQCENTPPKNMNPKKKSEWDADNTLII